MPFTLRNPNKNGFTLVELMVSMVVLMLIMLVATSVISQTQRTWMQGQSKVEQYREARMAFEVITQNVRQATLNAYMTYSYNSGTEPTIPQVTTAGQLEAPQQYIRHSELQFITGPTSALFSSGAGSSPTHSIFFQAPLGVSKREGYQSLNKLLCGRGYFLVHGSDLAYRPAHVTEERHRFRLMEYRPPAESNEVYTPGAGNWYDEALTGLVSSSETVDDTAVTRPVAENIVALIISPRVAPDEAGSSASGAAWIAPNYRYDSRLVQNASSALPQGTQHLLPPQVMVTLVAIDEASASRLAAKYGSDIPNLHPANSFINAADYKEDLEALEARLVEEGLNYRVFTTTVGLRNSKWGLM